MPKNDLNVTLKGIDELLFSTEEQRQEEKREQVQQIPIDELHPFTNHPFKVVDNDAMTQTVESIKLLGVTNPLIARPRPEGGYESLCPAWLQGHRSVRPVQQCPASALRKPKQERQPRKTETASSKQTLSEISKTIQGHQCQLTAEEKTSLKTSIENRYQERAVANGSLMMCEVQGAKEDFIRRWNTIFKEYPDVFEDSDKENAEMALHIIHSLR